MAERVRFFSTLQTAELTSLSPRQEHHEIRMPVRYVGDRQCDANRYVRNSQSVLAGWLGIRSRRSASSLDPMARGEEDGLPSGDIS